MNLAERVAILEGIRGLNLEIQCTYATELFLLCGALLLCCGSDEQRIQGQNGGAS